MRRLIAALALTIVPTIVQAADGNMLHKICGPRGNGIFYVVGVKDALLMTGNMKGICVPAKAIDGQLFEIVCNFVRDNPQSRHEDAALLTYQAIKKAFPCSAR